MSFNKDRPYSRIMDAAIPTTSILDVSNRHLMAAARRSLAVATAVVSVIAAAASVAAIVPAAIVVAMVLPGGGDRGSFAGERPRRLWRWRRRARGMPAQVVGEGGGEDEILQPSGLGFIARDDGGEGVFMRIKRQVEQAGLQGLASGLCSVSHRRTQRQGIHRSQDRRRTDARRTCVHARIVPLRAVRAAGVS